MKHKSIAFLVTVVMLLAMIPLVAFGTVGALTLTAPADDVCLSSKTAETVPVTFTVNVSDDANVAARISLIDWNDDEISFATRTIHPDDGSWSGTINLPVKAGTAEGVYNIEIALIQRTDTEIKIFDEFDEKVIIDNTAPTATIEDPDNMQKLSTGAAVEISGEATDADITITGTSISGSGIAEVALQITGPHHYSVTPEVDVDTNWDAEWTTPTVPGAYVISARATDEAGNVQETATTRTVYVGMDAPYTYTLEMKATEGGTCAAITAGPYVSGAPVSISASALSDDYEFTGWSALPTAGTFANAKKLTTTFTVTDDGVDEVIITANFKRITETDEDTDAYKAAPAKAAAILKYNNIKPNAKGEKGMNYISEVARVMDKGASFGDVLEYLRDITGVESLEYPID